MYLNKFYQYAVRCFVFRYHCLPGVPSDRLAHALFEFPSAMTSQSPQCCSLHSAVEHLTEHEGHWVLVWEPGHYCLSLKSVE